MKILGKEGLHELGFHIPKSSKLTAQQAIMLNEVEEELPPGSDIAKADDIELHKIMENTVRSMEDLIAWLDNPPDDSLENPLHKLFGLGLAQRR